MYYFIYILIGAISVIAYFRERYVTYLIALMALMTNCFMLLPSSDGLRGSDIALVSAVLIILNYSLQGQNVFVRENKYDKYVIYVILFLFVEFLITYITGSENLAFSLKVIRIPLLIILYFTISHIPLESIVRFFRYAFYITVINGIMYYLEFVGIDLLPDVDPIKALNSHGLASSCNVPVLSFIFLICCLSNQIIPKYRKFYLVFFLGILLLTFVRTFLFAFLISAVVYLILQKVDSNLLLKYIAVAVIAYPLFTFVLDQKDQRASLDSHSDLENILSGDFLTPENNIGAANGTFAFRMSMLAERVQYLIDNPQYMITGVGVIHEDSPNCFNRFKFVLGTHNSQKQYGMCVIESGDNTWVPVVLRYGIMGVLIYLLYFIVIFNGSRNRYDEWLIVAPIIVFYFLCSFSSAFFERAEYYFVIPLLLAILSRAEKDDISTYI